MKRLQLVKTAAVSLACWGFAVPQAGLMAAQPTKSAQPTKAAQAPVVTDIALASNGTLVGQVVNAQGAALDGAVVSLTQGKKQIAKTVAAKDGSFEVKNLKGGVYQVSAGQSSGLFRVWTEKTAPPSAKAKAVLVSGTQVVRGQMGDIDIVTATLVGTSVTGAVLGGINTSKLNDLEDEVNQIPKSN